MVLILTLGSANRTLAQDTDLDHFEKHVRPVFAEKCARCHATAKPKGGLRLDSREALLKGGASGPAIVPGEPAKSLLVTAIQRTDETLQMPPDEALPRESVQAIEEWIRRGAKMPAATSVAVATTSHWAFERVRAPAAPRVNDAAWAKDPLDAFVLARLEAKGLVPSKEADRRTLLRRASFDLVGLPPSKEDVDAFVADSSPDAFEKVVDRLLASPHFGERWGRHWLDVARYADTKGYVFIEERRFPYAYVYRDWVVRAFNEDLPYDRFLVEQIAADLLPPSDDKRPLAAMGFLTLGRRFLNNAPDIIDDRIDTVTRGTMGLTVSCARCHDHKFDPIPTADYYSLYGVFASSHEPKVPPLVEAKPRETPEYADFLKQRAAAEKTAADYLARRHGELLRELATDKQVARYLEAAKDPRDVHAVAHEKDLSAHALQRWRGWLAAVKKDPKFAAVRPTPFLDMPIAEIEHVFNRMDQEELLKLRNKVAELDVGHAGAPPRAPCLEEGAHPHDPHVFVRGNPGNRGKRVPRRFLSVLAKDRPHWKTSGRLELARAIASKENPLTARVFVNRVLLHLLGAPLVKTPSDFGLRSEPPTNPELLDHLAARFADDWYMKKLIRAVVLSATYRQASDDRAEARALDPENALLWRANRKRLDFEAQRDALLAVSGRLDHTIGGRAVDLASNRRTLYAFVERQNLPATFRTFDFASPDATSPGRAQTTVPQQALYFMNAPFVLDAARGLASRAKTVEELYALALARSPDAEERALAEEFLAQALPSSPSPWSYGYGEPTKERVERFTPLPHFTGEGYQGGPALPDGKIGWCLLHAKGGHPGNDQKHAVVRRFTSPVDGYAAISGKLTHPDIHGDGVRARIYSSEAGELGTWIVKHGTKEVEVQDVIVKRGTTIDFVIDCRTNEGYDSFEWAPRIRLADGDGEWDATQDFQGPGGSLSPRERLAQVLLETNEFVFED